MTVGEQPFAGVIETVEDMGRDVDGAIAALSLRLAKFVSGIAAVGTRFDALLMRKVPVVRSTLAG
ncbi:hypothetical protein [Mycobacterium ostraviense]|uniref:Uncharacterized protein n=1 Tax=Mycobacterium ostraviense TaxID=2738409 RepID=A0A164AHG9_9MYCO|nr:hypothetical protein [Mycobacterium ostraviense]KZS62482.1 hypothetical protein A4G28_20830 [Mycobacterium ostraviense]